MSDVANVRELLSSNESESIREGARLAGEQQLQEVIPDLVNLLSSHNLGIQEASDRALRKIGGANVVSAVIPLLQSDDPPVRNLSMDILRAQGHTDINAVIGLLSSDDPDLRIFAADILGASGQELTVPVLSNALLHDPEVNVRYQAAISLGALAFPSAAVALNQALNDEEWVQFSAIEALTKLRVESSVGAMITALDKSSDLVASMIIDALGEMGNIKAVPLLMQKLGLSPTALCNKIVRAIVNILGENSLSLLGAKDQQRLLEYMHLALDDEDSDVQDSAIRGLAALKDKNAVAEILKLAATLNPEKYSERLLLIEKSLAKIGFCEELSSSLSEGSEQVQRIAVRVGQLTGDAHIPSELIRIFWKSSRDVQRLIIEALGDIAPVSESQDFYLEVLKRHEDGVIIRGALHLLGKHGNVEEVEEPILAMLKHIYNDVKEAALEAAIALATPKIKEYFKSTVTALSLTDRIMATYALGKFSVDDYFEELKVALSDGNEEVRKIAVGAIGSQQPLSSERLALVDNMLKDEAREVRMAVIEALGDAPGEEVEARLIECLSDKDPWVRVRSVEKLGTRKSLMAIESLINMLDDDNHLVVIKAIGSLELIGGELAFQALFGVLDHPDEDIQLRAANAMESIRQQRGE